MYSSLVYVGFLHVKCNSTPPKISIETPFHVGDIIHLVVYAIFDTEVLALEFIRVLQKNVLNGTIPIYLSNQTRFTLAQRKYMFKNNESEQDGKSNPLYLTKIKTNSIGTKRIIVVEKSNPVFFDNENILFELARYLTITDFLSRFNEQKTQSRPESSSNILIKLNKLNELNKDDFNEYQLILPKSNNLYVSRLSYYNQSYDEHLHLSLGKIEIHIKEIKQIDSQ